ncbi:PfkB family carbohydrate kinase [Alienimonas californiensis]|uniref:Putative sugar kinase YdjH n=1 Tax=Alienimonas californiensis TaxID=2527989 RepID=A0A517PC40_9PLAN|nr:PfkB family carbohydrate kinase [Alienimonas californiensis]QDT16944.1 putative sugar kinase YdjH [Alienimonas californiensis]
MSDDANAPPANGPPAAPPADGPRAVVGLGELLWDEFPADGGGTTRRPGGAPANVAFQCHQLGLSGRALSRVGDDADGRDLVSFLAEKGLPTDLIQTDPDLPTGRVSVTHGADGPEYVIHQPVAWDALEATDAGREEIAGAAAICFGSLAQRDFRSLTAIRELISGRPQRVRAVFDVNLRQNFFTADLLRESLKRANVLKLNEAEVPVVARLLDLPAEPGEFLLQAADRWRLDAACVTRGPDGCRVLKAGDDPVNVPAEPVQVADTVGAGDAFTAGLIFALLADADAERCGRFANAVGGLVASRGGAMPELRAEFAALKAKHGFA